MKQLTNKEYEAYEQYKNDRLHGRILTPDGLRFICAGFDNDPEKYNGPLVKTSNEDLKVNIRSKACPVIIVAGNQRRHEKLIRESPLTMGLGRLG